MPTPPNDTNRTTIRTYPVGVPVRREPNRPRGFGRNRHLAESRIRKVVSEITGRPVGKIVEHGDGRQDAVHCAEPIRWTADDVERFLPLNDLRRLIYERARRDGMTHDEAIARLFPDGKILA